jgi:hypothetical protein
MTQKRKEILKFINENPYTDLTLVLLSEKAAKFANQIYYNNHYSIFEEDSDDSDDSHDSHWGYGMGDSKNSIDLDSHFIVVEKLIKNDELVEDVDYLLI